MHYFCINLTDSTSRKRAMESQLRRLGLEHSWVSAIDGMTLPESSFREFSDTRFQRRVNGRQFLAGEVGCALSHMKAYRKMLEAGHSHAVILEDDVVLDRDISRQVDEIARTMSVEEPEIVLLSQIKAYFLDGKTMVDHYQIVDVASGRLAWGYLINARAARLIMQKNFPVRFLADDWKRVRYYTGCHIRAVLPVLVGEHFSSRASNIHGAGLERRKRPRHLRSRLMRLPLKLARWWHGALRRRQPVTQGQTRLRRPPLTPVPTPSVASGNVARD